MDKVDDFRHSWFIYYMDGVLPCIRSCRAITGLLAGISGNNTSYIWKSSILGDDRGNPSNVSNTGFRMEIVRLLNPIILTVSARRMYYPKQYHYVQEIQKFNVADYRPR